MYINGAADHVLNSVRVGMDLLRECIEKLISLLVLELLPVFFNYEEISPCVQICLHGVPHCHCNLACRMKCENEAARPHRVQVLVVP